MSDASEAAFALERSHLLRDDLDWLPPGYRAIRWTVTGGIAAGLAVGSALALFLAKLHPYLYVKGVTALAAGGYYAGGRAARAALSARLRRLARGDVDLRSLGDTTDGELVHLRGRVRARRTVAGLTEGDAAVYRRIVLHAGAVRAVHEAACDFLVVGESGEPALVEVSDARLLADDARVSPVPGGSPLAETLLSLPLPPAIEPFRAERAKRLAKGRTPTPFRALETLLRDGDEVELLGEKSRVVDPTVEGRLPRDVPTRATLRGGRTLPLLIVKSRTS